MTVRKSVSPTDARRIRVSRRALTRVAASLLAAAAVSVPVPAQLISIKTVPLAQGDQFDIFPSDNVGMGGLGIALADTMRDPFANPAKGARLRGARVFSSPTFYSISQDQGGGRTLPLGAMLRGRTWYGGLLVAAQEVDPSRPEEPVFGPVSFSSSSVDALTQTVPPELRRTNLNSGGNRYAFGMLGRAFPASRTSVAASVFLADLKAVDGVDLLYANSRSIDQFGKAMDLRVGLLKEWDGARALDATILHNRFGMTHDVTYAELFWNPTDQRTEERARIEHNLDRTNTWGAHVAYSRPVGRTGWRMGAIATGNLMSHPKIPNYEIVNIPRDPGDSYAYNLGFGLTKRDSAAVYGLDVVYEPIWSDTWAEAAGAITTATGRIIPAGGKTIENDFRFSNAMLRLGASQDLRMDGREGAATVQLGLAVRSVHYWLDQYDNVSAAGRSAEERWVEWTPTWGATFRFPSVELRYRGRLTSGTGRPGVAGGGGGFLTAEAASPVGSNILAAPSGPLTLDPVRVFTHQLALSVPIR